MKKVVIPTALALWLSQGLESTLMCAGASFVVFAACSWALGLDAYIKKTQEVL